MPRSLEKVMTITPGLLFLTRLILFVGAVAAGAWLGQGAGELLVYGIAWLTDRDIAELKDMLIWGMITGLAVGALTGAWSALRLIGAGKLVQRGALVLLAVTACGGGALMIAFFDWPKSSGTPVVRYQLRLPPGITASDQSNVDLDLTLWANRSGHGCYIDSIRLVGDRYEIAGNFVLHKTDPHQTMSLRLNNATESYWHLPIKPDAPLEKEFGPWQRIEFIAPPRPVSPLPPGDYEIRYRVRKYM
ncbi:MAG: hypothetical protein HY852_13060 [Bradyrhizobium sp.]|uniref:hypothetical protein n=1 Tax=Bradyrhizobium sp. TaxID=376 RepID=UPI0025C17953|nr:hypothetical protein [Bradyrhizobium sp.]MBI5262734.1 hypothetical protein [Bradyrhizobium sp.]